MRKFTNHRNHDLNPEKVNTVKMYNALKEAAASLIDFKAFTKGKVLFKKKNMEAIIAKRNEIYKEALANDIELPLVGAFQKALRLLWNDADQDLWERLGADEVVDVRMYVSLLPLRFSLLIATRNQEAFASHMYDTMYALCRSGACGKLELVLFYAFRDYADRIDWGW